MPYNVTFSGQTKPGEQLSKKGILVGSVPFFLEEEIKQKDFKEKVEKSQSAIRALKSAVGEVDFLVADSLARHNFEIKGQDKKLAQENALKLGKAWMGHYETEKSLKEIGVVRIEHWKEFVLEHEIFESLKQHIKSLYKYNNKFRQMVDEATLSRCSLLLKKRIIAIDALVGTTEICKKYIFEECAAVLLFRYKGYASLVYTQGSLNEPTFYVATAKFHFEKDDRTLNIINANQLLTITAKYRNVSKDVRCTGNNLLNPPFEKKMGDLGFRNSLFSQNLKMRHVNSLPFAARMILGNVESFLNDPDIDADDKEKFVSDIRDVLISFNSKQLTVALNG